MKTVVLRKLAHGIKYEIPLVLEPTLSRLQQQHLKFFHLKNQGKECVITDQRGEVIKGPQIFSFVILRNPTPKRPYHFIQNPPSLTTHDRFELRISQGNHFPTSGQAKSVVAAGDIYTNEGVITKVTDQSGTFYTPTTDPTASHKKAAALAAISAFGLPTSLFVPFSTPGPLLFSKGPTQIGSSSTQAQLPLARPYMAVKP